MLARRRLSNRTAPVSNAVPQTRQTCCSREMCDLSFMTISGCTGGIARNRRQHGVAQQSGVGDGHGRSEEHTSELQSLMRISYAVCCLNKIHTLNSKTYYHSYFQLTSHNNQHH